MRYVMLLVLLACAAPVGAVEPAPSMVCGLVDVFDCSASECTEVASEDVGVPDLLRVDPAKKTLTALDNEFGQAADRVESATSEEGRIVLRARSGDRTLVLAIDQSSGDVMMTVADPKVTLVAFGECARP